MHTIVRDLQHGFRALMKHPLGTLLMILALALGIGLNASSFAMVSAIVLHPLPYPQLNRIMMVQESVPRLRAERDATSPANFRDWREQSRSFERLAAFRSIDGSLTGGTEAEPVDVTAVSKDFFPLLGIAPAMGRVFRPDEMDAGHAAVAVVSHGFWERRMGSPSNPAGRTVSLDGHSYTVIGVMPADFDFPLENEIWIPLALSTAETGQRTERTLAALGLLKPHVTVSSARDDLHGIALRLARQYPDANEGRDIVVTPLRELVNRVTDRFTLVLMATAGFVLLLACVNIANLQLAQAVQRQKEIAIRTALGAGRFRILRQLFTETLLLALPGGAAGLCLAAWHVSLIPLLIPAQVYHWVAGLHSMRIDGAVLAFTFAVAVAAGLLCRLPAALHLISRQVTVDTNEALKEGGRASSGGAAGNRLRNVFAIAEVSLALILLIGAGLMVRTFNRMLAVNSGFDPRNVLTMQTSLSRTRYGTESAIRGFGERALPALQSLPGVQHAAIDSTPGAAEAVLQEGAPEPRAGEPRPSVHAITPEFFSTLRLPIIAGRGIRESDSSAAQRVVVLSESIAHHYWPHDDPVGRRVRFHRSDREWLTVVGVAADVRDWFSGDAIPRAYLSWAQSPGRSVSVFLRTTGDPMLLGRPAAARLHTVDPAQSVFGTKSMDQSISEQTSGVRSAAVSMSVYAAVALLLAITGVYAVVSYSVAQRTHEIGVRVALGADRASVVKMMLGQALRIAVLGLGIGVPTAFALMRLMSSVLYNAVALDPATFVGFALALVAGALLAAWIPARRAAAVDPLTALRHE